MILNNDEMEFYELLIKIFQPQISTVMCTHKKMNIQCCLRLNQALGLPKSQPSIKYVHFSCRGVRFCFAHSFSHFNAVMLCQMT